MDGEAGAAFLKHFLADSIIRDFEHLRRTEFGGARWATLGQSYGGFLTLTYLSLFPKGVIASFTTGGIPHVPADATDVYRHTFPRMASKTKRFYERYPVDVERVAALADILDSREVVLPNGDPLTVERLQCLGADFGMKPSFERVHWMLDQAFLDGDGSVSAGSEVSDEFLHGVMNATSSRPLYWPLQEFIYANGELDEPIRWAAQRVTRCRCRPPSTMTICTSIPDCSWTRCLAWPVHITGLLMNSNMTVCMAPWCSRTSSTRP